MNRSSNSETPFHSQSLALQLNSINRMKSEMSKVMTRYEKLAKLEKNSHEVRKQLHEKRTAFLNDLVDKL